MENVHISKGRLWVAAVMMALVAVLALPAFAYAAGSFTGEYPAPGATVATPAVIAVDLAGAPALKAATAKITVNGIAYSTFLTAASTAKGYWTSTSVLQPNGSYKITWVWVGGANTNATIYCYPPASVITNGVKNIVASVTDVNNAPHSDSWNFTIKLPVVTPPIVPVDVANAIDAGCVSCHYAGSTSVPAADAKNFATAIEMGPHCSNPGCHYDGSPKHGVKIIAGHAAIKAGLIANSEACVSCHGSNVLSVGSRAAVNGTVTVPAVAGALITEHQGCSCHVYKEAEGKSSCQGCHAGQYAPHGTVTAHDTTAVTKCLGSGCHTGTLPTMHPTKQCATCHTASGLKVCIDCHADRIDVGGNVVPHYFTTAGHTAASYTLAGDRYMSDAAAMAGNGTLLNPTFHWTSTCTDCHSMALDAQHADPTAADSCVTCHKTGGTGAGDALKGDKWNKSCTAAGCHTPDPNGGVPVGHLVNGQMDYSHGVATSLTALPGGCSAPAGSGSYSGIDYQRVACHYSDIVQEHNRKIESGPGGTVVQTIAVSCAQCHASAQFKALSGTWDGTCDACHDGTVLKNHSIVGSAESTRVRALHDVPAYYSTGTTSTQGMLISGSNTMDAHGPLRTASVAAHPAAFKAIGCAQAFCHQNAYMKPGSGFYTATSCVQCHPASVAPANAPTGVMSVNNGAISTHSLAATVNSAIVAKGGATLTTMAVDPGTGIFGAPVAYSASYAITLPTGNGMKTVRVKYADSAARVSTYSYVISFTAQTFVTNASVSGGNGTISPSGAVALTGGSNQTFTFTPNSDYKVGTVTVDGSAVSSPGTSYTFTNIAATHTIVVTYAKTVASWSSGQPAEIGGASGDYVTGLTLSLASALPANSSLDFQTKYDIEDGWDFGYVQVSTNGGSTWTNLPGNLTTNANPFPYDGNIGGQKGNSGNGITGTSTGWVPAHFDLSAYSGQTVKIRLQYVCDWGFFGQGWNVNAITVGPTGSPVFTDDASTLKPQWSVTTSRGPGWSL